MRLFKQAQLNEESDKLKTAHDGSSSISVAIPRAGRGWERELVLKGSFKIVTPGQPKETLFSNAGQGGGKKNRGLTRHCSLAIQWIS